MNEIEVEIKQEASVVVGARISIVTLAELAKWWEESGERITTMSQLVGWSLDVLKDTLVANKRISESSMSVANSHRYLMDKRLYQKSMRTKSIKKVAAAIRFEGMREEGLDPKVEDPVEYNILHNENSVRPFTKKVKDNFDLVEWVQLEGYPEGYMYKKGDEEGRTRLIMQLKSAGIKSEKELTEEAIEKAREEGRVIGSERGEKE